MALVVYAFFVSFNPHLGPWAGYRDVRACEESMPASRDRQPANSIIVARNLHGQFTATEVRKLISWSDMSCAAASTRHPGSGEAKLVLGAAL